MRTVNIEGSVPLLVPAVSGKAFSGCHYRPLCRDILIPNDERVNKKSAIIKGKINCKQSIFPYSGGNLLF
jgi:hypothetical protein